MTKDSVKRHGKKGLTPFGIIAFLAGIALFAYFVRKAGVGQIIEGISRLGAGFARRYIRDVYGTPCAANSFKVANDWY